MVTQFLQVIFAVFGVMDPAGNVPVFITLTRKMTPEKKRQVALKAVLRAGATLVIFVFLGNAILELFQVSIESFRIGGGLVMILLGLQILFGISWKEDPEEQPEDISVVPLATPLIAGPGMIATSVVLAKQYGYVITLVGIAINLALELVLLHQADRIFKLLGKEGTLAFAKIMGLILVTIGVEFIRTSLKF